MIPEVNPYNNYRGDGVATLFDYDFFIQNGSQLIVEHIDKNDVVTRLEENIDYEIVVIEEEFAGYIKFPIEDSKFGILQENETLSLQLTLPFEQISEYGQSSLLDLNSIEFSLDYLTRLCQILKRQMERSVRVNEGSEATPEQLLETINNNAIVSTNAATLASQKADEAMESANVAINASEEIDNKISGFNESYEKLAEDLKQEGEKAKEEIETKSNQEQQEIINVSKEAKEAIGDIKVIATLEIGDIGIAPLGIDETQGKRRYLNGQIIVQDQYTIFAEKVKSAIALYPTLGCTEQEWQTIATMTVGGQVGKFVVDNEGGTIRLPKIIMPIQGLTDLSKLAEIVKAGLPNHKHYEFGTTGGHTSDGDPPGNLLSANAQVRSAGGSGYGRYLLAQDSAQATVGLSSNPTNQTIYGKSTTVQQEQIQYPYFIQVATGSETEDNIINEIELNNPFTLFDSKYVEAPLYNASWLIANGSYNGSNTVHPSAYQALLVENNTEVAIGSTVTLPIGTEYTKRGLSVKLSTDSEITDYDFVVNTTNETFRLPSSVLNAEQGHLYFYVGETVQNANLVNVGRIEEKVASLIPDNSSLISSYAMPSNKRVNLTLGASGTVYTAPANGWYKLAGTATANGQMVNIVCNNSNLAITSFGFSGGNLDVFVPVKKGEQVTIWYTVASNARFYFVYAEGDK